MGFCRYCNANIEHLRFEEECTEFGRYTTSYGHDVTDTDYHEVTYRCPECDRVLTHNVVEADRILALEVPENEQCSICNGTINQDCICNPPNTDNEVKDKSINDLGKGI
jgi:hypothetical protein